MTPSVKLSKKIIQDDPRNLVCYVTLSVLSTIGIPTNIFVVKYTPPISASDQGSKSFYNVAYVDQLADLPDIPEDKYAPCFLLSHTVTKSFANKLVADEWCKAIYKEIGRLLSTYEIQETEVGHYTEVDVTKFGYDEELMESPQEQRMMYSPSPAPVSNEAVSDAVYSEGYEVVDLSFDGQEVVI